jgi:hypothetical protein
LRQDLWLAGGTVSERVREDALEDWLSGATTRIPRWQRMVTGLLGALGLAVLYAFANPEAIPVAVAIVLVQRLWAQHYRPITKSVEAQVFRRAYELRVIARLIERLSHERFSDPRLVALSLRPIRRGQTGQPPHRSPGAPGELAGVAAQSVVRHPRGGAALARAIELRH